MRAPTGLHPYQPAGKRPTVDTLPLPDNFALHTGDALALLRRLPAGCVQTVVTSPPYYGLRDYGVSGQMGLESKPDCHGWATGKPCGACFICRMVAVFREVKRVLREDGTCWLNIGDSYSSHGAGADGKELAYMGDAIKGRKARPAPTGLKPKDLLLIPYRLALALQADGWYVRSDIIWHKRAPMPESVKDRPTKAHEYVFLLSKAARYYYDTDAVREQADSDWINKGGSILNTTGWATSAGRNDDYGKEFHSTARRDDTLERYGLSAEKLGVYGERLRHPNGRNLRTVWSLGPSPFPGAHFATFPPALPETCIKAGTSERGCCPVCGKPWVRVVERAGGTWNERKEKGAPIRYGVNGVKGTPGGGPQSNLSSSVATTTGWQPECNHSAEPVPCLVLDPFAGAGTTLLVANRLGRRALGFELNPAYVTMATRRIVDDAPLFAGLA